MNRRSIARPVVYMTRKESFSAAHTLNNKNLSIEENKSIFSKCNNCHGHNYTVEVTVRAPVEEKSGMCLNMVVLKENLKKIIDRLDHKNLDVDVEYFHDVISTTENLCVYMWNELNLLLNNQSLLYEIKIFETDKNFFIYRGEYED